ncbi:MAG: glycosyltransferase [Desulfobacteraceae bacterium]|nr:glycosyltransferase [Desulfobacteraceae bacterium]
MYKTISIITVVFNGESTIKDTISSIMSQDYPNIEYIIIDGGSTDGTVDIIKSYDISISKFISEPDNGLYDAMNKGIHLASGDIISTLNSDDVYAKSTVVSKMVKFIESRGLDAAYGDLVYIDEGNPEKITRFWQPGKYEKGAYCRGWVPPHPTFFCRKSVFERFGYFNVKLQIAADFELMLRFIEKHQIKVGYLPEVVVKMRTGGKANALKGIVKGNLEIIKSFRMNGLRISPWFFVRKPAEKISQLFRKSRFNKQCGY